MKVDSQVDKLVSPIDEIATKIAALLAKIPFAEGIRKGQIIKQIEGLLRYAEDEVREWANEQLLDAADDHDHKTLLLLPGLAEESRAIDQLVSSAGTQLRSAVRQVTRNALVLARRLESNVTAQTTVKDLLKVRSVRPFKQSDEAAQEAYERHIRDELTRGFVSVTGTNGRIYRYAMDYLVGLQAFMSRQLLLREISIYRTQEAGFDLVQISPNLSTIGDFCDLYAGRVFSISGTNGFYPPLSSVPNGGTPMHPWCRHYLLPFTSDVLDPKLADVPDEFLQLGADGSASTNDFQRLWLQYADNVDDEG